MSNLLDVFVYPPLLAGDDSIRILSVHPGDFYDPLLCSLKSVTFSRKPKYVALSYAWGVSYPDNARLPVAPPGDKPLRRPSEAMIEHPEGRGRASVKTLFGPLAPEAPLDASLPRAATSSISTTASVSVNGQPFNIHHNLHLTLLHLRSPTHELPLWVDAICINQADVEERSAQVAIMSFIYMRAAKVVAWLGTREHGSQTDLFRCLAMDWKTGQSRYLAESLSTGSKLRYSPKPDQGTVVRITESSYWSRLWIVQEVCLPRFLVFVYGSKVWAYEDMRQWETLKAATESMRLLPPLSLRAAGPDVQYDGAAAMLRLFDARDARHTESMALEDLIEAFAKQKCTELRDRVFSLLGIAIDVRPYSNGTSDSPTNPGLANATGRSPESEPGRSSETTRAGRGRLKVDYSRPFYRIWADVVQFAFSRPARTERWGRTEETPAANPQTVTTRRALLTNERRISLVRTAGVIQEALGQMVEKELATTSSPKANIMKNSDEASTLRAMGYLGGEIVEIGPECSSLAASFQAYQDWLDCRERHYCNAADSRRLRQIDEEYAVKIMSYEQKDLARIREIRNPNTVAWRVTDGSVPESLDPTSTIAEHDDMWAEADEESSNKPQKGPVICLGTNHLICVVPPAAKVGDVVVRFWGCDAAMVMRPMKEAGRGSYSSFLLVGRADVAEVVDRKATPGRDPHAEQALMIKADAGGAQEGPRASGSVFVDMDLPTLQLITASIVT
ncbi:hypothetical protein VTK56DRAFT_8244 [Thermocarpiscus australiensis]